MPPPSGQHPPPRIQIARPWPLVDCGRHPAKASVGDEVDVYADVFRDGHDVLRATLRAKAPGARKWTESPMRHIDEHLAGNRWHGTFAVDRIGRWTVQIEAWTDHFASWRREVERKVEGGQEDLAGELSEGAVLVRAAAERAQAAKATADHGVIAHALEVLQDDEAPQQAKLDAGLGAALHAAVERHPDQEDLTELTEPLVFDVDRLRGRFGAWYELFPRSWGGFAGVTKVLPDLADLGFDVLYLPPIHPIGVTNRKGRNNSLVASEEDPGSPWAIGLAGVGGHDALHPDLGTMEEFETMVGEARRLGIDVALDFAIQCSADHPWLTEHPEWFNRRPDGTLKYAENPPKRYQDIYNVNFDSPDWRGLWQALLDVVLFWCDKGIRAFRVDNPHTKPVPFWEWLIAEVRRKHPETIFLSEAFTRRAMLTQLAKVGFSQSYTYFTWKNASWELREFVSELCGDAHFLRPNFFVNTPDILHAYLQHGGPAAFHARLVLAATLSPSYGIYSGFEHFEGVPVREGSEEYLDSEKYEAKERTLDGPLLPVVKQLNEMRRAHPCFQRLDNITFLDVENEALIAYAKKTGDDVVIVVVNLDPHWGQQGVTVVPAVLGTAPAFAVRDMLTGDVFDWRLGRNFVGLGPGGAHVLEVLA